MTGMPRLYQGQVLALGPAVDAKLLDGRQATVRFPWGEQQAVLEPGRVPKVGQSVSAVWLKGPREWVIVELH